MKGQDLITLLEYVKTFNKAEKTTKRFSKKEKKEVTFKDYLEFHDEMERYKKWEKDQEKLNKKEEKKEPKFTVMQKTMFFALAGPPLGILYMFSILALARSLGSAAGVH